MIDVPLLLNLEEILVGPQLTQQKWEKVQKRNYSLFGPLEIGNEAESERNGLSSGERGGRRQEEREGKEPG